MKEEIPITLVAEDYQNLLRLIHKTPIVGGEAEAVAMLKYKLSALLTALVPTEKLPDNQKK